LELHGAKVRNNILVSDRRINFIKNILDET